jgi:hypothetical protein
MTSDGLHMVMDIQLWELHVHHKPTIQMIERLSNLSESEINCYSEPSLT